MPPRYTGRMVDSPATPAPPLSAEELEDRLWLVELIRNDPLAAIAWKLATEHGRGYVGFLELLVQGMAERQEATQAALTKALSREPIVFTSLGYGETPTQLCTGRPPGVGTG